jgi:hypothetical protein
MVNLFTYYKDKPTNLVVINLEDHEFFKRYRDGVPTYVDGGKRIESLYAMVHLDGPHDTKEVRKEVEWFSTRMDPGAFLVCDDTHMYPHFESGVHDYIMSLGYKEHRRGQRKISYVKV